MGRTQMGGEYTTLPDDLPEPEDDGAADHLVGRTVPSVSLPATNGETVDLSTISGRVIVYCYPKTGRPDEDVIPDGWNSIPGARGCTPESCGFRDHYQELLARDVTAVFGLSLQSSSYQREARDRLELPFELLSDSDRTFTDRLDLPTFAIGAETFHKRLTLVLSSGTIEHVFYPVFPPDTHAVTVVQWLDDGTPSS
ncbi:MAG: peroxiredoxin [Halobacteriales archaeon]